MHENLALENVIVEWSPTKTGDVATVWMNRPDRRNALSLGHMHDLLTALRSIADTDAVGVVIGGKGPVFSAGHDFADMAGADKGSLERSCRRAPS